MMTDTICDPKKNTPLVSETSPSEEILSNPALLFLYYRIEHIFGIKTGIESLEKLNEYLEKKSGNTFIKNPSAYDYLLTSREQIHKIAKFITINETYFFRESCHFELLSLFLPEFANSICAKLNRPLQICCAAVSIGCEAYSIAMLLDYYNKKGIELDYSIDAFDIDAEAIETAKNARYSANSLRSDTLSWKHILDSYLILDNSASSTSHPYLVTQNIRRKVHFFPHNIMRGLDKQYDIIFFRNVLIYFSLKHRLSVINNLSEALYSNGLLFLGVSETASINHPLLANCFTNNVFYFQKLPSPSYTNLIRQEVFDDKINEINDIGTRERIDSIPNTHSPIPNPFPSNTQQKETEKNINICEIAEILKNDEGKTNAQKVLEIIINNSNIDVVNFNNTFSCNNFAAAVSYFLNTEDYNNANLVLNFLEKYNTGAITQFLRAEYYFFRSDFKNAENIYQEVIFKDKYFWPAFYRIAITAAEGNITRFEYKINKTIECIELLHKDKVNGLNHNYECFMGGFSPDYFRRILEKKLLEKRGE